MKKTLVMLSLLATSLPGWAQTNGRSALPQVPTNILRSHPLPPETPAKTLTCIDTLRYPMAKQQILGNPANFYAFNVWQSDGESISQTFINSGTLSLTGAEFIGARNASSSTATITATVSVYNVDATNTPTTLLGSGNVNLTGTAYAYQNVNFATPITVTGNYALVISPSSTGSVLNFYINDRAPGQSYDENLAKYKSNYYTNSAGAYVSITTLTTGDATNFPSGPYNFEPVVAPFVNYSINTQFNTSATSVCLGTPVTYTNATTPMNVLSSRMNNYQIFRTFFGTAASDSTFVYDMDNLSPYIWTGTTTYTHPAAGSYDVLLATNGGFWNSCFDYTTHTITVNPIPAAPSVTSGGATTFCAGNNVVLTSSAATGNSWSPGGASTPSITVSTSGTYSVTTTAAGCTSPASSPVTVTVTPLDNASFNYASSTLCTGGANVTPTASMAGTFSSTAGLTFVNASTGEIDLAGSSDGTYVITHTTAGTCPNTATQTITITAAPSADFSYTQTAYCTADVDPSPNFASGASAGTFSSTTGLMIDGSTGTIDLSGSMAGTYTVTNDIAASGSCPAASETFSVTINPSPAATVSGGGAFCGVTSAPVTVTLTGAGPWDITYTDGTTPTTVTGVTVSPFVINATANGTYTVSQVTMNGCSSTGTGSAAIQLNPNPVIAFSPVAALCASDDAVILTATPSGGTFSGTGVSGDRFYPVGLGGTTTPITYSYTDANGCSATATQNAVVNANPVVTLATFADMCDYNDPITLSGGMPAGGVYSGNGVNAGEFDPGNAGLGSSAITYFYTDANGCSNVAVSSILVDECLGLNNEELTSVTISPNPTTGEFVISTSGNEVITFVVLTEDGKVAVAPRTVANGVSENVSLAGFAKGVYFVRLSSVTGSSTKKIVLQ